MNKEVEEQNNRIEALELLKTECINAETKIVGYQDNDKLLAVLNEEYPKAYKYHHKEILAILDGKKSLTKLSKEKRINLENKLIAKCFVLGIDPLGKDRALLPLNKISLKIQKEISIAQKTYERMKILNLFTKH